MRKIGIYGGTFDPIHHGHLILGRQACEELGLDQLIFVPALLSPFKKSTYASGEMRLSMLQAAIAGQKDFLADDCELKRPPPSYSIDTVLQIRERDPNAELFWLIGADNVSGLDKWHRIEALRNLVQFVVLDRGCGEKSIYPLMIVERNIDISESVILKRDDIVRSIRFHIPQ